MHPAHSATRDRSRLPAAYREASAAVAQLGAIVRGVDAVAGVAALAHDALADSMSS
jgi:hypothetical protein